MELYVPHGIHKINSSTKIFYRGKAPLSRYITSELFKIPAGTAVGSTSANILPVKKVFKVVPPAQKTASFFILSSRPWEHPIIGELPFCYNTAVVVKCMSCCTFSGVRIGCFECGLLEQ